MDLIARVARHFEESIHTKQAVAEMLAAPIAAAIESHAKRCRNERFPVRPVGVAVMRRF